MSFVTELRFLIFLKIDLLKNEVREMKVGLLLPNGISTDQNYQSIRKKRQISRSGENVTPNSGNKPKVLDRAYGVDLSTKVRY